MLLVLFNPNRALSGATTPGQSGPGSDGNEVVLRIPQSSSTARTSPSDCLVSYPGHSLGGSYPSAKVQSVYSTAPADWANIYLIYMYKEDLALNNLQWLICHETQPNQQSQVGGNNQQEMISTGMTERPLKERIHSWESFFQEWILHK